MDKKRLGLLSTVFYALLALLSVLCSVPAFGAVEVDRRLVPDGRFGTLGYDSGDVRYSNVMADKRVRLTFWRDDAVKLMDRTYKDFAVRRRADVGGIVSAVMESGGFCYIDMPIAAGNYETGSADVMVVGNPSQKVVVMGLEGDKPIFRVKAGHRLTLSGVTLQAPDSADAPVIEVEEGGELVMKSVTIEPSKYGLRGGKSSKFYIYDVVFRRVAEPLFVRSGIVYVVGSTITDPAVTVRSQGERDETLFLSFENVKWYDTFGKDEFGRAWTNWYGESIPERSFVEYSEHFKVRYWMDFDWNSFKSLARSGLRWFDRNNEVEKSEFTLLRDSLKAKLGEIGITEVKVLTDAERRKLEDDFQRRDAMDFYRNEEVIGGIGTRLLTAYLLTPLFSMGTDMFSKRSEAWWKGIGDEFDANIGSDSLLYDIIIPGIVEWGFYPPFLEMTENQFRIDGKSVAFLCASYKPGQVWDILRTRLDRYEKWLEGMSDFKKTASGYTVWLRYYEMMRNIDRYVRYVYFDVPVTSVLFSAMAGWTMFLEPDAAPERGSAAQVRFDNIRKLSSVVVSGYMEIIASGLTTSSLVDTLSLQFLEMEGVEVLRNDGFERQLERIAALRDLNVERTDGIDAEVLREEQRRQNFLNALERKRREIEENNRRRNIGVSSGDAGDGTGFETSSGPSETVPARRRRK